MKTYLLESKTPEPLARLEGKIRGYWMRQRCRAILVGDKPPPKKYVREVKNGNQIAWARDHWLSRTVLDELHEEYVHRAPVPLRSKQAAIRHWELARQQRAKALEDAEKARQAEYVAAARVVATHGRGPVVVDGETYDPCYQGDSVYLIRRRIGEQGAGNGDKK